MRRSVLVVALILVATTAPALAREERANRALAESYAKQGTPLDPVLVALAENRLVRSVEALLPGQVAAPSVSLGYALSGAQLAPLDITATETGQQEVEAFVERLLHRGIPTDPTKFTIYTLPRITEADHATRRHGGETVDPATDPLGSVLIVPTGTAVDLVGAVFEDGQLHVKTTVSAPARPAPSSAGRYSSMAAASDSAQWQRSGGVGCLEIKQNSTAHYYPCQWFHNMVNDGDPNFGYWASEMYGTGKSHSIWTLSGLEVDSRRKDGTARQEWVDWDPGADGKQNCASQTVSVSYAGVGVSVDKQHCELWDIDKGRDPFDMSNWWRGEVWRSERETAAMTLTRTRAGEVPHGTFDFDFYAHP